MKDGIRALGMMFTIVAGLAVFLLGLLFSDIDTASILTALMLIGIKIAGA